MKIKLFISSFIMIVAVILLSCNKEKILEDLKPEKEQAVPNNEDKMMALACGCSGMPNISITKNLVTDFGATPNDGLDDSKAFICAAVWLNANWSTTSTIRLYIPLGVYNAGVQLAPGASFAAGCTTITNTGCQTRLGVDMIRLTNAKNIAIFGDPGTTVIYNNGLYFGGYTIGMTPVSYPVGLTCPPTTSNVCERADIGAFINLINSSCINISNLRVSGNNTDVVAVGHLGGHVSECNGYQLGHDGIIINGSDYVSVTDVSLSNFCRDGIMIMNNFSAVNPQCPTLTNVVCNANSRQGLSLTAGDNLLATNCQFNRTGTVFYNNPGCGVDIEPEFSGTVNFSRFINCKFLQNAFCGMISDNHPVTVNTVDFSGCEFYASAPGSWSIWPKAMQNTTFTNSTIRGAFVHVAGTSAVDRIKFNGCFITDWNAGQPVSGWCNYLMNFGATDNDNFEFNNCKFEIHRSALIYTITIPGFNRIFSGNVFSAHWNDLDSWLTTNCNNWTQCGGSLSFWGRFYSSTLNSNQFADMTPSSVPVTGNDRYAPLAQIGAGIQTNGNNSFPFAAGFFNHFTRQIDVCCCTVSSANF